MIINTLRHSGKSTINNDEFNCRLKETTIETAVSIIHKDPLDSQKTETPTKRLKIKINPPPTILSESILSPSSSPISDLKRPIMELILPQEPLTFLNDPLEKDTKESKIAEQMILDISKDFDENSEHDKHLYIKGEVPRSLNAINLGILTNLVKLKLQNPQTPAVHERNVLLFSDSISTHLWNLKLLGKGNGGSVFKILNNRQFPAVVKMATQLKSGIAVLLNEIAILEHIHIHEEVPHIQKKPTNTFTITCDPATGGRDNYEFGYLAYLYKRGSLDKIKLDILSQPQIIKMIKDMLQALTILHEKKVIHGDLKLENIFLDGDDCYIADFGRSVIINEDSKLKVPLIGTDQYICGGTPSYCFELATIVLEAPSMERTAALEKFQKGRDVYSAGLIFKALLQTHDNLMIKYETVLTSMLEEDYKKRCSFKEALTMMEAAD